MSLFRVRAVGTFGGKGEVAAFSSANPDNIGSVKVVEMFLEVRLASKLDEVAVQEAHRALVLLQCVDVKAGRGHRFLGR